ncbi:MAG: hypothetical protein IH851_13130 [Armatimonadetes bacterium]|nr:hypothetical protein [Armatimonadota bacterium]
MDLEELAQLEVDMLDWFDRVLNSEERATGANKEVLKAASDRLEAAAEGFSQASDALAAHQRALDASQPDVASQRLSGYMVALELLLTCCPE